MADEIPMTFRTGELLSLAAKLEDCCKDLDGAEQALLHAIFERAGEATAAHAQEEQKEVSGFVSSYSQPAPEAIVIQGGFPSPAGGLLNSFQWGVGRGDKIGIVIQGG
jgi:hypothetical protein